MTSPRTPALIRADIRARESEPHGEARIAAAGALVDEAHASGDRRTLVAALNELAATRVLAARARAALEPAASLLGLWDERGDGSGHGDDEGRGDGFGEGASVRLRQTLAGLVEGLLDDPDAPLAQVEEWLALTHRHLAEAGGSPRTAHRLEVLLATHVGDAARADASRTAWLAAEPDAPADCAACDLVAWGGERLAEGDDEGALEAWQSVLRGEQPCATRPYDVHARALLPLVRLGRTEEARLHHIRGYLLARDEDGARRALAGHLSFCARTGNEPRALEILHEQTVRHPDRWLEGEDPGGYGAWNASVALLTRRLMTLGHGDTSVPGPPGQEWTAASLMLHASAAALDVAERFDRRRGGAQGTPARDACRSHIVARPLLAHLPLGLGGPDLHTSPVPAPASAPPEGPRADPAAHADPAAADPAHRKPERERERAAPHALLAEARSLSAAGHPSALAVWARLEEAVEHTGTRLADDERAELLDHRAMELVRTDPAVAAARFTEAAQLHTRAGAEGEALACRARAVLAAAFAGEEAQALAEIGPLCERAHRRHAQGRLGTRHATAVLLTRARIYVLLLGEVAGEDEAAQIGAALDAELAGIIALAEPDRDEPAVLARIAEATQDRGRLAAQSGESERAAELLTEAATLSRAAGRPWAATGAELTLARLWTETGEHARAAALLGEALEDGDRADVHTPGERARLHLALADACAAGGQGQDEVTALVHAAHWAARAGRGAAAVHARMRLAGRLLDLDRLDECEAVLESLLPQLLTAGEESAAVQACDRLAQACDRAGRLAEAAEWLLLAADSAHAWQDRRSHAAVAHLAADALRGSGQYARAMEAYARAEKVWRVLGDTDAVLRTLHARAWLAAEARQPVDEALGFMEAAHREIAAIASETPGGLDGPGGLALRLGTGHTHRQTAQILAESADRTDTAAHTRALDHADRAAEAFHACGEDALHEATGAELYAAALETGLGRHGAARARAARVRKLYPSGTPDPDGTVAERLQEAARIENRAAAPGS